LPLLCLFSACGGPSGPTDIPEAQVADPTSADIGNHIIYFNAQSTDQLLPEIARKYNIMRDKNRAMLNISVIRKSDYFPVIAKINLKTVNLTGQLKKITLRKIEEPGIAIYYIGDTTVANHEVLIFDISVKPEGENKTFKVLFKRQFYSD